MKEQSDMSTENARSGAGRGHSLGFWMMLLALALLVIGGVLIFLPFWKPLFLAAVVTSLLFPVHARVLRLVGEKRRGTASLITCLLCALLILLPVGWLAVSVATEARGALLSLVAASDAGLEKLVETEFYRDRIESSPSLKERVDATRRLVSRARRYLRSEPSPTAPREREDRPPAAAPVPGTTPQISRETIVQLIEGITGIVGRLLAGVVGLAFKVFLMLFLMFYFFKDGADIVNAVRRTLPVSDDFQERVLRTFHGVSGSMVKGTLLTALAQGVVAGITYLFLGIPAFFWGAMTAICALVPAVGTGLVTIPLTVAFMVRGQWVSAIVLAIVAVLISAMDNLLRPYLVEGELKLHPVWVLLSILGGVSVFGPTGIVLGPLVVVMLRTVLSIVVTTEREGPGELSTADADT